LAIACGERSIPIGPNVVNTLREWKLVCPKGDLDLVFPNNRGKLWDHVHIVENFLQPTLVRAGIVDANGKAKYPGLHALRHFYASYCINRRKDGGLELTHQDRAGTHGPRQYHDYVGRIRSSLSAHRRRQGDGRSREDVVRCELSRRDMNATCGEILQHNQQ